MLVENLLKKGYRKKSDCMNLSDESLLDVGLPDIEMVHLFKAFLVLYDIKPAKTDIAKASPQEIIAKTEQTIAEECLNLKVPLLKEVKTHIAVARVFAELCSD